MALEAVFGRECECCHTPLPEKARTNQNYCSTNCGNIVRRKRWRKLNRDKDLAQRRAQSKKARSTPEGKFRAHKDLAKQRGLEFELTFEQWWELWEPHWEGRGIGGLVMCRENDDGPYKIGNVRIDTQANNNKESWATGGMARATGRI